MSIDGRELMGVTEERWEVLEDILNLLVRKEKTPAKVMLALDKMTDIRPIEKLLMVYALAWSIRKMSMRLSPENKQFLPIASTS